MGPSQLTLRCFDTITHDAEHLYFAGKSVNENKSMKTAWRKLHHNLVLVTRQQLGKTADWGLPVIEVTGEDTLRSVSVASNLLIVNPFLFVFLLYFLPI